MNISTICRQAHLSYKQSDSQAQRHRSLDMRVKHFAKTKGITVMDAAKLMKKYLNRLRIYQRYRRPDLTRNVTADMRYLQKRYGFTGVVRNIV